MEPYEEKLKQIDLTDDTTYQAYTRYMKDNVVFSRVTQALDIKRVFSAWFKVHSEFREQYPDKTKTLDELVIDNSWTCVIALKEEEIIELFQLHLAPLFNINDRYELPEGVDMTQDILEERLRQRLVDIFDWAERDVFKKKLLEALVSNQERFSTAEYFIGIKQAEPTIQHWINEYLEYINGSHTQFILSRFVKVNENAKRLSQNERHALSLLLQFYEHLRVSSFVIQGMEERIPLDDDSELGTKGYLERGIERIYPKSTLDDIRTVMKTYQEFMEETGQPMPKYLQELTGGITSRPPVNAVKPAMGVAVNALTGPNVDATAGPDHFTEQDATDVQRVADTFMVDASKPAYQQTVQGILQELKLTFSSPELEKKFTDLLTSVVRGLRDTMELQSYVMEMNYSPADVDRIIKVTKAAIASKVQTNIQTSSGTAQALPNIQNSGVSLDETMGESMDETLTTGNNTTQSTTQFSGIRSFLPKLRRSRRSRKPMIDDVKLQESMVMGPIEELRAMDLVEFRRLAPDPVVAANKLRDKINLLAEESVSKQAEGIQAFKASPLNMHYLELGNQSIASGQAVSDVISDLEAQGKSVVSVAEFNAITDLNRGLRF